jgi:hypothetical protein
MTEIPTKDAKAMKARAMSAAHTTASHAEPIIQEKNDDMLMV